MTRQRGLIVQFLRPQWVLWRAVPTRNSLLTEPVELREVAYDMFALCSGAVADLADVPD